VALTVWVCAWRRRSLGRPQEGRYGLWRGSGNGGKTRAWFLVVGCARGGSARAFGRAWTSPSVGGVLLLVSSRPDVSPVLYERDAVRDEPARFQVAVTRDSRTILAASPLRLTRLRPASLGVVRLWGRLAPRPDRGRAARSIRRPMRAGQSVARSARRRPRAVPSAPGGSGWRRPLRWLARRSWCPRPHP
jgi:hypothetical protein